MEKMESALDVLSRAATMVQPCPAYPASDSDSFETPSTASSGESEGDRTLSPEAPRSSRAKEPTGKWRRDRRATRLPEYRPRENGKMALRSQSFHERRGTGAGAGAGASAGASGARAHQAHSDGELSDAADEAPTDLVLHGKVATAPPEYGARVVPEAPIDMRLRSRPAPPPYCRASVITGGTDAPPGSMSMCDPVIDEHFRRSLGDDYMTLFKKTAESGQPGPKPNTKDRASSPILFNKPTEPATIGQAVAMTVDDANLSVDDHFAKALGDTWKQIQTSRLKEKDNSKGVDDHFSKALGDTWKKIKCSKDPLEPTKEAGKPKEGAKIMSRSGVVI